MSEKFQETSIIIIIIIIIIIVVVVVVVIWCAIPINVLFCLPSVVAVLVALGRRPSPFEVPATIQKLYFAFCLNPLTVALSAGAVTSTELFLFFSTSLKCMV